MQDGQTEYWKKIKDKQSEGVMSVHKRHKLERIKDEGRLRDRRIKDEEKLNAERKNKAEKIGDGRIEDDDM